ncbi:TPA: hypothetical protein N2P55_003591 [Escherichia coli]|nr:hypothetical protein [Escherichia coli]HCL6287052.1 hypothetical protein [Escherichia coli]
MSDQDSKQENKEVGNIDIKDLSESAFGFILSFCTFLYLLVKFAAANDDSLALGILRWFISLVVILFTAYSGAKLIEKALIYTKYKGEKDHD